MLSNLEILFQASVFQLDAASIVYAGEFFKEVHLS